MKVTVERPDGQTPIIVVDGYCQECNRPVSFCQHWGEYDRELTRRLEACRARRPVNPMLRTNRFPEEICRPFFNEATEA